MTPLTSPILAGMIQHLMNSGGNGGQTPQYPTDGNGHPMPSDPVDDYQKLIGLLQGLYGGKQGLTGAGGTISNNGAAPGVMGPNGEPRFLPDPHNPGHSVPVGPYHPEQGADGTTGNPGNITWPVGGYNPPVNPTGSGMNYTLPGQAPKFPQNPMGPVPPQGPQLGGLHPAIAAQIASGILSSMR